jgi:hypothetical protein
MSDTADLAAAFIARWARSGAAERANYVSFLKELCDLLGVPHPDPTTADNRDSAYVFERTVYSPTGDGKTTPNFIDLYKRGCFVLEAKQGADSPPAPAALSTAEAQARAAWRKGTAKRGTAGWDDAMLRAKGQADLYIRALPATEGRPPFLLVVDVGHSIELYAEFSCTGGAYVPFPAAGTHRIPLQSLAEEAIRERLRLIWTDPHALDPAKRSAKVTREIAQQLGALAASLEGSGHPPATVAAFLMRCLFTMFAEDVFLLPPGAFTRLLESLRDTPALFQPLVEELWAKMNTGGMSVSLRMAVLQFNGGLFADNTTLPLNRDQLHLLIEASRSDWRDVEPAIFGTLLERALEPRERHKLGAHYTPRAYVERLVLPTLVDPLRREWEAAQAAAVNQANQGELKKAVAEVMAYHQRLCEVRILDPACGSGNFLYVALEHLKRIEGEVFDTLDRLGERQGMLELYGHTVDPHQLLGLELNPRAAAIAELVLWIGALQWHFRTRGAMHPPQPIIRKFENIVCRDAVLAYDAKTPRLDADGEPITIWDGRTTKLHPVTGRDVPDESARLPVFDYTNPRPADWPAADFIIGNPPFIGTARMRDALGDGYVEALRAAWKHAVPDSADFVMYWWRKAGERLAAGDIRRFGFITTNSIHQTFNRRVLEPFLADSGKPVHLAFAIPDHPWVDTVDGAAVRIAMTVAAPGNAHGTLATVAGEIEADNGEVAVTLATQTVTLAANLRGGADLTSCGPLKGNTGISNTGVKLHGSGFIITPEQAIAFGLGSILGIDRHIRLYRNGKDLTNKPRGVMVIDAFGLSEVNLRERFPAAYQHILLHVKPERDQNAERYRRENWWLFGRRNTELRAGLAGLPRYIATVETSKHRFFTFLDQSILPDNMLVNIAHDDAWILGVLSSTVHVRWALAMGGRLGVGNDPRYNKSRCFEPFPFPAATDTQQARIREVAERLDAHRKRQQAQHPALTLTGLYNVLEKLRRGEPLTVKERQLHDDGLVSILKGLHDDLDRAVLDAYAWADLSAAAPPLADRLAAGGAEAEELEQEVLSRLVALNHARAAEEARGEIRWLRPAYQAAGRQATAPDLALDIEDAPAPVPAAQLTTYTWPKSISARIQALRAALAAQPAPVTVDALARLFHLSKSAVVSDLLDTLVDLGFVRVLADGRYEAAR